MIGFNWVPTVVICCAIGYLILAAVIVVQGLSIQNLERRMVDKDEQIHELNERMNSVSAFAAESIDVAQNAAKKVLLFQGVVDSVLRQEVALCKAMNTVTDKIGEVISEAAEVKRASASVEKSCEMVKAEVEELKVLKGPKVLEIKGINLDKAQLEDLVKEMEKYPIRDMYS